MLHNSLVASISSKEETRLKTELLTQKEKINSLEEDLVKKNEKVAGFEDNIKSLTADKERYEVQLTSVRQVPQELTCVHFIQKVVPTKFWDNLLTGVLAFNSFMHIPFTSSEVVKN